MPLDNDPQEHYTTHFTGGARGGEGGRGTLAVRLSRLTINHGWLARLSTVFTSSGDISNMLALITFLQSMTQEPFPYLLLSLIRRL